MTMSLIFDISSPGKNKLRLPESDPSDLSDIPGDMLNDGLDLADVGEAELVRYYTGLSRMNFGVDNGMYPLGSCTMKYNPRINEKLSMDENFIHQNPWMAEGVSRGCLELMHGLGECLSEITGMHRFSLMPAAGAHGELTGVMIVKKHFEKAGGRRSTVLIPDSAHGTNPASVTMCGFQVRQVPSDAEGNVDLKALEGMLDGDVAAMMLTSPSTLGLFDPNIRRIADMIHGAGGLFYCDGANLNAVMGVARVADMGFDIMHINLHKTFSTPHGGGGPGAGPVGVTERLAGYLPVPQVVKEGDSYRLSGDFPDSIGSVHSFYGNFLVMVRAYAYILRLGGRGIREAAGMAVLNANYLRARLKDHYHLPIDRICMHEFVLSDRGMPNGISTNDIAKRILDFRMHAPTVYFPLLIDGAIMIEPTETESRANLDRFVDVMLSIRDEAQNDPETVRNAPHLAPVKRVDAVAAARKPVVTWKG